MIFILYGVNLRITVCCSDTRVLLLLLFVLFCLLLMWKPHSVFFTFFQRTHTGILIYFCFLFFIRTFLITTSIHCCLRWIQELLRR